VSLILDVPGLIAAASTNINNESLEKEST
jgi:hypothetical protein